MANPPSISLSPGVSQYVAVNVVGNNVQPDGSNPGQPDATAVLIYDNMQNLGTAVVASSDGVTADGRRIVKLTPLALAPGSGSAPWSVKVRADGHAAVAIFSGTTSAPLDVSGVFW